LTQFKHQSTRQCWAKGNKVSEIENPVFVAVLAHWTPQSFGKKIAGYFKLAIGLSPPVIRIEISPGVYF